jgi:hypothetical protein
VMTSTEPSGIEPSNSALTSPRVHSGNGRGDHDEIMLHITCTRRLPLLLGSYKGARPTLFTAE